MGHRPGAGGGNPLGRDSPSVKGQRISGPVWWGVVVAGAVPVACLAAFLGLTLRVVDPIRDIAVLLLWSSTEEIVFRGGVQPCLAKLTSRSHWFGGGVGWARPIGLQLSAANLATSALFSAAHLWSKSAWVALGLFPVSLILGASLERSGRLLVPVALHAYFNLLLYSVSALIGA